MEDWHRQLALGGSNRALGKAINGAGNIAFFFLAVSGLYLWWPRKWRTKGLKRSLWFVPAANAKARDWNWHNVIGLWSAPVLIVLTLTALPISYRWAGNLIFTLTGTPARGPAPDALFAIVSSIAVASASASRRRSCTSPLSRDAHSSCSRSDAASTSAASTRPAATCRAMSAAEAGGSGDGSTDGLTGPAD
jgi:uncharacterized iron-regulated membrane protein